MDTNTVKETIFKISEVAKRLFREAEEIFEEGKRRAREKIEKPTTVEDAEKNFSIERPDDKSAGKYQ